MTPIATKNNAIILKDGSVGTDCGCCVDVWRCTGGAGDPCVLLYAYQPAAIELNGVAITGVGSRQLQVDQVPYSNVLQYTSESEFGEWNIWTCDQYGNTGVRAWHHKIRFYNLGFNNVSALCENASPRMGDFVDTGDAAHDESPVVKTIETVMVLCSGMASCSLDVQIDTTRRFRFYKCSITSPSIFRTAYVQRNWWPAFPSDQYSGPIVLTHTNIAGIADPIYTNAFSEWGSTLGDPNPLLNLAPPDFHVSVSAELQPSACVP
jgi:hypothetical protein